MPEVEVGGVRIAYQRRGSGAPLVPFHAGHDCTGPVLDALLVRAAREAHQAADPPAG